jgi:DNA-binding NarL/FixJ family response regulator
VIVDSRDRQPSNNVTLARRITCMPFEPRPPCKGPMIDILLVDDSSMMRQLLRDILEHYPDIRVVGEAPTGEDAIVLSTQLTPTVVIIDINLPTISGMEATRLIKRQSPGTTIIGLTAGLAGSAETAMRDAGAKTVLSKGDLVHTLYPTIVEALKP